MRFVTRMIRPPRPARVSVPKMLRPLAVPGKHGRRTIISDVPFRSSVMSPFVPLRLGETVTDDDDRDILTGASGLDWFFFNEHIDRATDLHDEVDRVITAVNDYLGQLVKANQQGKPRAGKRA